MQTCYFDEPTREIDTNWMLTFSWGMLKQKMRQKCRGVIQMVGYSETPVAPEIGQTS